MQPMHLGITAMMVCTGALSHALVAQTRFNGVITFTSYEESGKQSTVVQTTKGHKVRLDGFGGSQSTMIIDEDAKVMMMVTPENKQYLTMTEEDVKQSAAMMAPMMEKMKHESKGPDKLKLSNTGKVQTVAGVPCQVWRGTYGDQEGEACLAHGVGFAIDAFDWAAPMMRQGQKGLSQYEEYRRMVGTDKGVISMSKIENGKTIPQMVATKIEPKSVSDDLFKPPAGFKEVKMGDMMRQAQGAMKEMQEKQKQQGQPQQ